METNRLGRYIFIMLCMSAHEATRDAKAQGLPTNTLDPVQVWAVPFPDFGPGGGGGGYSVGSTGSYDNFVGNYGDYGVDKVAYVGDPACADGSDPAHGNPIVLSTGNKVEEEVDFESAGEMPLRFARTYNANYSGFGMFGSNWKTNFDYTYQEVPGGLYIVRPNGKVISFTWSATTPGRAYENKASPVAYVDCTTTMCTHYAEDLTIEKYVRSGNSGRIVELKNLQGIGLAFTYITYPYGYILDRVTHTSGRYIQFGWTNAGGGFRVTQVTAPDGSVFNYSYSGDDDGNPNTTYFSKLLSTTRPAAAGNTETRIDYHYEDARFPSFLTGKSYQGVRYSTFSYDNDGRAVSSKHHAPGGYVDSYSYTYTGSRAPLGSPLFLSTTLSESDSQALADTVWSSEEAGVRLSSIQNSSVVEVNPLGRKATYGFSNGKLTTTSEAISSNCPARSAARTYDANDYPDRVTDFNGNVTDYDYNAKGQLTRKVEASGTAVARTTTYDWDAVYNRKIRETVIGDHESAYTYGADHRIASVVVKNLSPNGVLNQVHTWTYAYTKYPSGIVKTMTVDGPQAAANSADAITYSYTAQGDLSSISNTFGHVTSYASYNGLGQPGRMTAPNGDITDYAYFPGGKLKQITTYPSGSSSVTAYTYTADLVKTVRSPDGVTTLYTYDSARRLIAIDVPELNGTAQKVFNYDNASNPTAVGIYRGAANRYFASIDYDELGRVIGWRGTNGQNFRYGYDGNGNRKKVTDSLNRVTSFTYDPLDRLSTKTDAKNGIARLEYDSGDRVKKVTDPRGVVTTYSYDGFGQLRTEVSADRGTTSYGYTASGFRNAMTRGSGQAETYAYDDIGRLITINAGGQVRSFGYDVCGNGKGRLCTVGSPYNTVQYQYEPDGRVRSRRDQAVVQGLSSDYTTSYGYDAYGRLIRIGYPNGQAVNYSYGSGQLSAMTLTNGGTTSNLITGTSYEPLGPVTGYTYGNGLTRTLAYDRDRRLTSLSVKNGSAVVQSLIYTYNANDLITQAADGVTTGETQTYGYDELSRLIAVTSPLGNRSYGYDASGNRTASNGSPHTIASNSNRMATTSVLGASTFTYDGAGNTRNYTISGFGSIAYNYDTFNQMQSVVNESGVTVGTYGYNGFGERTTKNANHGRYRYQYGEDHRLLSEYSDTGGVWTNYLWYGSELIGLTRGGQVYFLHTDHQNKPRLATSGSRTVVWRVSKNDPYGRGDVTDAIGGLNVGLPGQYFDKETGLWYNVNRYYDAIHGRYWASDPIGALGGVNTYAYVGGNPITGIDPLGLNAMAPVAGWIATDSAIPDPSDAAWPKWAVYGLALGGAWALDHWVLSGQQDDDGGAQAPGRPTSDDGYECPKKWDGKKVKSPNGRGYGWPDKNGNVWVPTGPGSGAHGGPHWDVQKPGGGYDNVYPGGRTRGGR